MNIWAPFSMSKYPSNSNLPLDYQEHCLLNCGVIEFRFFWRIIGWWPKPKFLNTFFRHTLQGKTVIYTSQPTPYFNFSRIINLPHFCKQFLCSFSRHQTKAVNFVSFWHTLITDLYFSFLFWELWKAKKKSIIFFPVNWSLLIA